MRSTFQTTSVMLILGILLIINAGCGRKHLHVSTMSGAPGEGELAMELDDSGDQSGLGDGSGLDESALANQGDGETEAMASSTDDLEPLDFTHNAVPPSETSDSQLDDNLLAGLPESSAPLGGQGGGAGSQAGQEIQTQSPSFPPLDSMGDGTDSLASEGNSDNLPPLTAFTNPDNSGTGNGTDLYSDLGIGNDDAALPVEQIPGNIAIAKAEPSEAFREQLDKMKAEEEATLAAGLNDVFFEFDSWNLTSEGRQALNQGADWLNEKASSKLLIEGHCDSRGTQAYNLVLGKKRAGAIRDYLVELGITQDRVAIISYGQDKPFCSDSTEVCYQLNRRGHLLVQNP